MVPKAASLPSVWEPLLRSMHSAQGGSAAILWKEEGAGVRIVPRDSGKGRGDKKDKGNGPTNEHCLLID